jgi:hypothetical protein
VFGSLLTIALISIVILLQDDASTETQTFARTLISAILAGLVGYFGGAAGKAPSPIRQHQLGRSRSGHN